MIGCRRCLRCRRLLTRPESMEKGMGPVCAAKCERVEEQLTLWETNAHSTKKDAPKRPG